MKATDKSKFNPGHGGIKCSCCRWGYSPKGLKVGRARHLRRAVRVALKTQGEA